MDDATLAARQCASQMATFAANIGSAGSVLRPADGVIATVVPSVPNRSLPNSVLYADAGALTDEVLDELGAAYRRGGRPGMDCVGASRGRCRDIAAGRARPPARRRADADGGRAGGDGPDAARAAGMGAATELGVAGRLNDRAYGMPGDFERLGGAMTDEQTVAWVARVDGEPAGCAGIHVHEGDAEVWMVAVVPEARGRGLSAEILRHALSAAARAGATTTSLEASAMGEATYRRLGYRSLGRLGMWEKRTPG